MLLTLLGSGIKKIIVTVSQHVSYYYIRYECVNVIYHFHTSHIGHIILYDAMFLFLNTVCSLTKLDIIKKIISDCVCVCVKFFSINNTWPRQEGYYIGHTTHDNGCAYFTWMLWRDYVAALVYDRIIDFN